MDAPFSILASRHPSHARSVSMSVAGRDRSSSLYIVQIDGSRHTTSGDFIEFASLADSEYFPVFISVEFRRPQRLTSVLKTGNPEIDRQCASEQIKRIDVSLSSSKIYATEFKPHTQLTLSGYSVVAYSAHGQPLATTIETLINVYDNGDIEFTS